jgi:hypothetical protein
MASSPRQGRNCCAATVVDLETTLDRNRAEHRFNATLFALFVGSLASLGSLL